MAIKPTDLELLQQRRSDIAVQLCDIDRERLELQSEERRLANAIDLVETARLMHEATMRKTAR